MTFREGNEEMCFRDFMLANYLSVRIQKIFLSSNFPPRALARREIN